MNFPVLFVISNPQDCIRSNFIEINVRAPRSRNVGQFGAVLAICTNINVIKEGWSHNVYNFQLPLISSYVQKRKSKVGLKSTHFSHFWDFFSGHTIGDRKLKFGYHIATSSVYSTLILSYRLIWFWRTGLKLLPLPSKDFHISTLKGCMGSCN